MSAEVPLGLLVPSAVAWAWLELLAAVASVEAADLGFCQTGPRCLVPSPLSVQTDSRMTVLTVVVALAVAVAVLVLAVVEGVVCVAEGAGLSREIGQQKVSWALSAAVSVVVGTAAVVLVVVGTGAAAALVVVRTAVAVVCCPAAGTAACCSVEGRLAAASAAAYLLERIAVAC